MAFSALAVVAVNPWIRGYAANSWWIALPVILMLVLAIAAHNLAKGRTGGYWLSYTLNAICSGCMIGILYIEKDWAVELMTLLYGAIPAAVLGLMLCLGELGKGKTWRKVWDVIALLLTVALIVGAIVLWVKWNHVLGSFAFFCGVCQLFFHLACAVSREKPQGMWRYLSLSGFWAFAVIAVVVIVILSEGDILDSLDFDIGSKKKKAKK